MNDPIAHYREVLTTIVAAADKRGIPVDNVRRVLDGLGVMPPPAGSVTMTAAQLREALEFINPDGPGNAEECEAELTFAIRDHQDDAGEIGRGLVCWNDDTDGVYPLDDGIKRPARRKNAWREAVIDASTIAFLDVADNEADPRAALDRLIDWHVAVALDPQVSTSARALVEMGQRQASQRYAEFCRLRDHRDAGTEAPKHTEAEAFELATRIELGVNVCTCPSGDGSLSWPCPQHAPVAVAPVGWKLVPMNPTYAMLCRFSGAEFGKLPQVKQRNELAAYRAMLAVAPFASPYSRSVASEARRQAFADVLALMGAMPSPLQVLMYCIEQQEACA